MKYNITMFSIKAYFEYLNVNLFDRKVNFFDLISLKKKLRVISTFKYSYILKELNYYLRFIEYLR